MMTKGLQIILFSLATISLASGVHGNGCMDLFDYLGSTPQFSILNALLRAAVSNNETLFGLEEIGSRVTLFAPTDDAISRALKQVGIAEEEILGWHPYNIQMLIHAHVVDRWPALSHSASLQTLDPEVLMNITISEGGNVSLDNGQGVANVANANNPIFDVCQVRLFQIDGFLSTLSDTALIRSLFDKWNAALVAGDPEAVADFYSPEAILLPTVSNSKRYNRELLVDYFVKFIAGGPDVAITDSFVRYLAPNVASNSGFWTVKYPNGAPSVDARVTFVYKKYGSEWLIVEHHSSVLPEATPATDNAGRKLK